MVAVGRGKTIYPSRPADYSQTQPISLCTLQQSQCSHSKVRWGCTPFEFSRRSACAAARPVPREGYAYKLYTGHARNSHGASEVPARFM